MAVAALGGSAVSGDGVPVLSPWPSGERHGGAGGGGGGGGGGLSRAAIPALVTGAVQRRSWSLFG